MTSSARKLIAMKGSRSARAQAVGGGEEGEHAVADLFDRAVGHQAGDGEGKEGEDLAAARHGEAAVRCGDGAGGGAHGGVVGADDDEVVMVVGDGARDAPSRRPMPWTKPRPVRPVPWWRSTTAIFRRSRCGSATARPSFTAASSSRFSVRS